MLRGMAASNCGSWSASLDAFGRSRRLILRTCLTMFEDAAGVVEEVEEVDLTGISLPNFSFVSAAAVESMREAGCLAP